LPSRKKERALLPALGQSDPLFFRQVLNLYGSNLVKSDAFIHSLLCRIIRISTLNIDVSTDVNRYNAIRNILYPQPLFDKLRQAGLGDSPRRVSCNRGSRKIKVERPEARYLQAFCAGRADILSVRP